MILIYRFASMYLSDNVKKCRYLFTPKDGRKYKPEEVVEGQFTPDRSFITYNYNERCYYVFDNYKHYFDEIKNVPQEQRCFHEVIFGYQPQKLKFDIDIEAADDFDIDTVIGDILAEISDTFFATYQRVAPIILMCSTGLLDNGNTKYSYHIVIAEYYVANNNEAKAFTALFFRNLPIDMHKYVDIQVNKSTQNFRIIGNQKGGRIKELLVVDTADIMNAENITPPDTIIQNVLHCELLPSIVEVEKEEERVLVDVNTETILDVATEYTRGHRFKERRGNIFIFRRVMPSHCELCDRVHHHDNTLLITVGDTRSSIERDNDLVDPKGGIYLLCRHAARGTHKKIGEYAEGGVAAENGQQINIKNVIRGKIESAIDNCHKVTYTNLFERMKWRDKNVYNNHVLQPFEYTDTLCVKAAMKMGKTKALAEYIDKYYKDSNLYKHKIVFLSFRQTFSGNIKERFPDFTLYSEVGGQLKQRRLIIQIESLHRYNLEPGDESPDLLILDESESILEQFNSGLLRQFNAAWSVFEWLLKYSKHVIAMDANMSDRTYRVVDRIRCTKDSGYKIKYHHNEFMNATDDQYYITESKPTWIAEIFRALDTGAKIAIPTSSLSMAKIVHRTLTEKYPDKYIAIYSSETTVGEKREHFADVHRYWSAFDVIIYTPTVSAGISFEADHFDNIFAYFTDSSCTDLSCIQMLGRIRNIRTKTYYICLEACGNNLPTNVEEIKRSYQESRLNMFRNPGDDLLTFEYGPLGEIKLNETNYFHLWLENTRARNLSVNGFIARIIYMIYSTGATIDYLESNISADDYLQIDLDCRETRKEIQTDVIKSLLDAPDIIPDEAEVIERKMFNQEDVSTNEMTMYSRYRLRRDYNYSEPLTEPFIAKYKNPRIRKIYKNIIRTHSELVGGDIKQMTADQQKELVLKSLNALRISEQKIYIDAVAEGSDLTKRFVYELHRIATGTLHAAGFSSIYDPRMIPETILYDNIKKNEKAIYDGLKSKRIEFGIHNMSPAPMKTTSESAYVRGMLSYINKALANMYCTRIISTRDDAQMFTLNMCKLFATTPGDKSLPSILVPRGYEGDDEIVLMVADDE